MSQTIIRCVRRTNSVQSGQSRPVFDLDPLQVLESPPPSVNTSVAARIDESCRATCRVRSTYGTDDDDDEDDDDVPTLPYTWPLVNRLQRKAPRCEKTDKIIRAHRSTGTQGNGTTTTCGAPPLQRRLRQRLPPESRATK